MHSRVPQTIAATDTNDECVDVTDTNEVEIFDFLDVTEPAPPFPHMTIEGEAHELRGGHRVNLASLFEPLVPRKPLTMPVEEHEYLADVRRVGHALGVLETTGCWRWRTNERGEPFETLVDYVVWLGVALEVIELFPHSVRAARPASKTTRASDGKAPR